MNKKMIFTIIGTAIVLFLAFGFYKANGLKTINIVKTVTINGTKEQVFDMVKYLSNYPKWSPFLAQDPSQKYEIKGTDGAVGVQFHWDGNKGKDLGFQEITAIEPYNVIRMKCDIQKPFKAQPEFNYRFKEIGNSIEVTQDFRLESGLVDAFFMWLFSAETEMEKTNQQGMDLLKKAVEK
jgi:ribosome-associated toxin RatA of RatAB toxin-antitoxin module